MGSAGTRPGSPGAGGPTYNPSPFSSLIGGSRGGDSVACCFNTSGLGGSGGGAIQTIAPSITISGSISATGGAGGAGNGGGGGGSGGAIWLRGSAVRVTGSLLVTGGAGGGAFVQSGKVGGTGGAGGFGRIQIDAESSSTSGSIPSGFSIGPTTGLRVHTSTGLDDFQDSTGIKITNNAPVPVDITAVIIQR